MKNVGNSSRGRSQGVPKIQGSMYMAHRAVIFATAQLSCWQSQLINLGLSSIALSNYIHLDLAYCPQSTPLFPCNHKNINCRSDWRDPGRIERGTPTPGHL